MSVDKAIAAGKEHRQAETGVLEYSPAGESIEMN